MAYIRVSEIRYTTLTAFNINAEATIAYPEAFAGKILEKSESNKT